MAGGGSGPGVGGGSYAGGEGWGPTMGGGSGYGGNMGGLGTAGTMSGGAGGAGMSGYGGGGQAGMVGSGWGGGGGGGGYTNSNAPAGTKGYSYTTTYPGVPKPGTPGYVAPAPGWHAVPTQTYIPHEGPAIRYTMVKDTPGYNQNYNYADPGMSVRNPNVPNYGGVTTISPQNRSVITQSSRDYSGGATGTPGIAGKNATGSDRQAH